MGYVHGSREGTLQKSHFDNMLVTYCFIVVILIVCMFVFRGMCMNAGTFEGHKLLLPPELELEMVVSCPVWVLDTK